jgi:hypothetical protein
MEQRGGGGLDGGPAHRWARSPEAERVAAEQLRVGTLMVVLRVVKTDEYTRAVASGYLS